MIDISVVITTCNRDKHILKETIDSVINQTYKNYEIIVVNDSPTYQFRKEIDELVESYGNRIVYRINEKPYGANYARNLGASIAKGEYISFLDDDDYWAIERLEKVKRKFEEGVDIVYSDFYIFSEKKRNYTRRELSDGMNTVETMLYDNFLGGFSNVSIRKSLFDSVGGLDNSLTSYQDQDLFMRLLQKGKVGYIPEALSYYRISPNSISLNAEKKMKGLQAFLENYKDLFEIYPHSKRLRLESELVYAEKQGWYKNANLIATYLKESDSDLRILLLRFTGRLKFFLIKYFKVQ